LDEPHPGRPRTVADEQVEQVITRTLETSPNNATHWSTRALAAELGLSQTSVSRIWRAFGLQPHRQDSWKRNQREVNAAHARQRGPGERASGRTRSSRAGASCARSVAAHTKRPAWSKPYWSSSSLTDTKWNELSR